jgi:hypothetical protein
MKESKVPVGIRTHSGEGSVYKFGIEGELFDHGGLTDIEMVTHQEMGLYR